MRLPLPLLAFTALLLAYGNAVSAVSGDTSSEWAFIGLGLALMALALVWARRAAGLSWQQMGLADPAWPRHLALGAAVGGLVILPVLLYFLVPVGVPGGEIGYDEAERATVGSLLLWALVRQPLGVSIFEEVMFRGLMQGLAVQAWGTRGGVGFVAVAFALWHLVVNYRTVQETNLAQEPALAAVAQVVSLAGLMVGSLVLSWLRLRSGGLAAPIGFHWATVVAMQSTLFALAR
ncbi:MAG TPA: CPBP family intramembrane glutamic endopeptidase [Dehalococcoidia bacterium]|nr:CPBP family intramembrane glutamic endopeptidase [Dehalococcoidia bacterium]